MIYPDPDGDWYPGLLGTHPRHQILLIDFGRKDKPGNSAGDHFWGWVNNRFKG